MIAAPKGGFVLITIACAVLSFHHPADCGALRQGDAEGVVACGQLRDVDMAGVGEAGHTASGVVVHLYSYHALGLDSNLARSGIGIDGDEVESLQRGDADVVANGQQQHNGAVAAFGGLPEVVVLAASGVSVAVPCVAALSGVDDGVEDTVVDGEVEMEDTVAPIDVLYCVGCIMSGSGVSAVEPSELVAGGIVDIGVGGTMDGELQGVGALAAEGVEVAEGVGAGERIEGVVPEVAVAGIVCVGVEGAVVDGEVEGYHAVASHSVNEGVGGLRGAGGVGDPTPCETITHRLLIDVNTAVVDGEMEGDDAVAAFGILEIADGGGGAGGEGVAVPCKLVTCRLCVDGRAAVVKG